MVWIPYICVDNTRKNLLDEWIKWLTEENINLFLKKKKYFAWVELICHYIFNYIAHYSLKIWLSKQNTTEHTSSNFVSILGVCVCWRFARMDRRLPWDKVPVWKKILWKLRKFGMWLFLQEGSLSVLCTAVQEGIIFVL